MKIVIPGIPQAKVRHRLTTRGGFARMYDPQEKEKLQLKAYLTRELKALIRGENKEIAMKASILTRGEFFELNVCFYVPYPKSATAVKRNAMLWGLIRPNTKPDLDNLLKFLCDAANEVLFSDDCKIVDSSQKEFYSDKPRTEITIMAKKQLDVNDSTKKIIASFSPNEVSEMITLMENIKSIIHTTSHPTPNDCEFIAAYLSKFADLYADPLKKISKSCPSYWKNKLETQ
jgi:Holliday junction resolvase RusA-like endonuclease